MLAERLLLGANNHVTGVLLAQSACLGERTRPILCSDFERAVLNHKLIIHTPINERSIVILDRRTTLIQLLLILLLVHEDRILHAGHLLLAAYPIRVSSRSVVVV